MSIMFFSTFSNKMIAEEDRIHAWKRSPDKNIWRDQFVLQKSYESHGLCECTLFHFSSYCWPEFSEEKCTHFLQAIYIGQSWNSFKLARLDGALCSSSSKCKEVLRRGKN